MKSILTIIAAVMATLIFVWIFRTTPTQTVSSAQNNPQPAQAQELVSQPEMQSPDEIQNPTSAPIVEETKQEQEESAPTTLEPAQETHLVEENSTRVSKDLWANVGSADPQDSFQTMLWRGIQEDLSLERTMVRWNVSV